MVFTASRFFFACNLIPLLCRVKSPETKDPAHVHMFINFHHLSSPDYTQTAEGWRNHIHLLDNDLVTSYMAVKV